MISEDERLKLKRAYATIRKALEAMHAWVDYHHGCKACLALIELQKLERDLTDGR